MKKLLVIVLSYLAVGCATIVGDPIHTMPISSSPSDAVVLITDEKGREVFKGLTPTTVTLNKSDGSYFGGKSFIVKISKEGYETQLIPVSSHMNGWYIGGNFIFGGLVGWLIIDPLNGSMYKLSPDTINASLGAKTTHNNKASDGSVTVMLVQDVPPELRGKMKRID